MQDLMISKIIINYLIIINYQFQTIRLPVLMSQTLILVNPLKGSGVRWLHFKVLSAIQV